jgi:hypothetical protein
MGLVPDRAEVGDIVCIVPGLKILLLFRKYKGAKYGGVKRKIIQLIGSCYMHEVINKEAVMNRVEVVREEYIIY